MRNNSKDNMFTLAPSFSDHMTSLQKDQKDTLGEALTRLHNLKLINIQEGISTLPEIAITLTEQIVSTAHRLQECTDLKQKLDLISALLVMMSATNLINLVLARDTKADTRRINAILYMR